MLSSKYWCEQSLCVLFCVFILLVLFAHFFIRIYLDLLLFLYSDSTIDKIANRFFNEFESPNLLKLSSNVDPYIVNKYTKMYILVRLKYWSENINFDVSNAWKSPGPRWPPSMYIFCVDTLEMVCWRILRIVYEY